jgi:hypothetical protein
MSEPDQPSREELLRARSDIQVQLDIVEQPMKRGDYNPGLVAKLRSMLEDIDDCLAVLDAPGFEKPRQEG